jgi:hypothetical protein
MKRGAIRRIIWDGSAITTEFSQQVGFKSLTRPSNLGAARDFEVVHPPAGTAEGPQLDPATASAEEEAQALLRIAAEVEGVLLVQYLFTAYSVLPGVSLNITGGAPILSDNWYDTIRTIAKQEMGHLITVQNLLLSVNADPHFDRENLPWTGIQQYPFPFSLQPLSLPTLAKNVSVEAPRQVAAADQADYEEALQLANGIVGHFSRAGQIYERLYWLFQDDDTSQPPWNGLRNPFPEWRDWHVNPNHLGFNQDRQASDSEWRGDGPDQPVDSAIYVLPTRDKVSAREAIYRLALQGEGPVSGAGETHFDKFLTIYREFRSVSRQPGAPAFVRNQAPDPRTGLSGTATITDPTALAWGQLGNTRYQMLLIDIALSFAIGPTGTLPGSTAKRNDFIGWAFREMLASIKPMSEELRQMPLKSGATSDQATAGFPFELPEEDLPATMPNQLSFLRQRVADSIRIRAQIQNKLNPTPKQQGILRVLENLDTAIAQKIGSAATLPG